MADIEPIRTLTDQVFDRIREGIVNGEFRAGEHHSVQTFVDRLSKGSRIEISRAPVREALVRLSEAGMVRFARNRGIEIVQPTVSDLREIFQLRLMVEPAAAGRVAPGTDDELLEGLTRELQGMRDAIPSNDLTKFMNHDVAFHNLILEATGNRRLCELVRNLRDATSLLGLDVLLLEATDLGTVMEEHIPVLKALQAHDRQTAAVEMYKHVADIGDVLMRHLAKDSGGFDSNWADGIIVPIYNGGRGESQATGTG